MQPFARPTPSFARRLKLTLKRATNQNLNKRIFLLLTDIIERAP